ncbi:MAG: rane protein [Chloroflexi bacterium]|nr:rane protein [Chloroflexota bacterium]
MNPKSVSELALDWWSVALRGALAVITAVVIVVSPVPHESHLLRIFGTYVLLDGLLDGGMAAQAARQGQDWRRPLANGVIGVIAGVLSLSGGGLSVAVRADIIGLRTLALGVSGIRLARRVRAELPENLPEWLLTACGWGSVVFSVIIFIGPTIQASVLGRLDWLATLYLLGFGALLLTLAGRLRAISRDPAVMSSPQVAAR